MEFFELLEKLFETKDDKLPNKADAIIAVGCDVSKDGMRASPQSESIALKTAELFIDGKGKNVIVSGGYSNGLFTEAAVMYDVLNYAVPEKRAAVENQSAHTTYCNAECTLKIMRERGWKSAILVAQQWHARRVRATFKKCWRESGIEIFVVKARSRYGDGTQWRLRHFVLFFIWDTLSFVYFKMRRWC